LLAALLCIALTSGLAACGTEKQAEQAERTEQTEQAPAEENQAVTFTDDLGNEVTVKNPQRVVACMGSFAQIWELAGGSLIGVSDDALSDYTITSKDASTIGDFSAPNLEQILALEPDFVLMTGATTGRAGTASQVDLRPALVDSGIPVAYFTVTVFDDYLRMLRICCDITGRDELYTQNGTEVQDRIAAILAKTAAGEQPTALIMTTYSGGTRVQGATTQSGAMLADLGAKNLADENPSLLKDFSLEAVIEANPDFIFVVPMGNDDALALQNLQEATAANPAWATIDAVANGRYIVLEKELFLYKPNANWDKAYQTLYDYLYGA
jgi:iron complex transport system substrate-binding protein